MKNFSGQVLFLDRSDINTDEIIPARYLTEIAKDALKPYLLEDLTLDGFNPQQDLIDKNVLIARANFGCGSSREHAPWALEVNGINLVIAESFARIFKRNMFNCGMMAVELPVQTIDHIFTVFGGKTTRLETDFHECLFLLSADEIKEEIPYTISDFEKALVEAGGWVDYADSRY